MNRPARQAAFAATITAAFVGTLMTLSSCGGDAASINERAQVVMNFTPSQGGTFTAKLDGQSFSSAGWFPVTLSPDKTYELTGSFTGNSFHVRFSTSTAFGVQSGSLVSLDGPTVDISGCGVTYIPGATASYQFRIQFKSTSTIGLVCA